MKKSTTLLIGLIGVILLTILSLVFHTNHIEHDVKDKATDALAKEGVLIIDSAKNCDVTPCAKTNVSGRDVTFNGTFSPDDISRVHNAADDKFGIRNVEIITNHEQMNAIQLAAEEAARLKAEAEAKAAEEEARLKAEAEAKAAEKAARLKAEAEAKAAEEEARLKAEVEAKAAEEEARLKAEAGSEAKAAAIREAEQQAKLATMSAKAQNCQQNFIALSADKIQFKTGHANISNLSLELINKYAQVSANCPDTKIYVVGHTDNVGSAELNQQLSEQRAQAVTAELIKLGVSQTLLSASGKGASEPLMSNDSAQGRAKNRRIEFSVVPE